MPPESTNFLRRLALLGAPFLVLLTFYVWSDPFKVIHHYDTYYQSGKSGAVVLNRDYVSVETLLNQHRVRTYDSFIFGNSRSMFYPVAEWTNHIASEGAFHLDASVETIYGILQKLKLLAAMGVRIRHALITLDCMTLEGISNSPNHLMRKHPLLSGESQIRFQQYFLEAFLDQRFLRAYLTYRLFEKLPPNSVLEDKRFNYKLESNELSLDDVESQIERDPAGYYASHASFFWNRDFQAQQYSSPTIGPIQEAMLEEIRRILAANQSDYRIVIHPLFDQAKFSDHDHLILDRIFGANRVFDFSGINGMTSDIHNYYEFSHYRPQVAVQVMKVIYSVH